jgi:hypothetical protein
LIDRRPVNRAREQLLFAREILNELNASIELDDKT